MNLVHHPNATLQIAPVILVMMLYFGIKEKDKRMLIIMSASFIITSAMFLFFTLYNPLKAYSNEFIMASLQRKADFPLNKMAILSDNYALAKHIGFVKSQFRMLFPKSLVMIITFIPIITLMIYILKECLKNTKGKEKLLYAIIPMNLLSRVPLFIITCDYGRTMTYISITQMLILFMLIIKKDEHVLNALEKVNDFIGKHFLAVFTLAASYGLIDRVYANIINDYSLKILQYGLTILKHIIGMFS